MLGWSLRPNAGAQPRGPQRAVSRFSIGHAARVGCSGLLGVILSRSGSLNAKARMGREYPLDFIAILNDVDIQRDLQ